MRTQGAWTDPPRQQQASVGRWTLRVCALYWGCLGHRCSVSLFTVSHTGRSTAIYDQWLRSKKRESGEPKCSAKGRKTQVGAVMHDFLWHGFFIRGSVPPNPSGSRARDPSGHCATAPARSSLVCIQRTRSRMALRTRRLVYITRRRSDTNGGGNSK